MKMVPATRFLAALLSLLLGAPRPAGAASEAAVPGPLHLQPPLLPHPPYRMWSFAYNATTGGPECKRSQSRPVHYYCDNATADYKEELYPPNSYNLLNPAECFNTTQPQARWLAQRGVACMAWESCWNTKLAPNSTDEAVIGGGCYFLGFVQLSEKYGTLIERYAALIEKVSPCRALSRHHREHGRSRSDCNWPGRVR
eukprot:SAG31_NODE_1352_length_8668_cov_38.573229_6_plen_198_part_00